MNFRFSVLCLFGSSFLAASHLYAAPGTQLVGVSFSHVNSPFYAIDKATGSGQQIGLTGAMHLNSLAQDSTGVLYSYGGPIPTNQLFTINPATGQATFVTLTHGAFDDFLDLAFSSDNTLYGVARGNPTDWLVTIDVGTGAVSAIGNLGVAELHALDFAPDGTLYGWDAAPSSGLGLITINPVTGQVTDVNPAAGGDGSILDIAFDTDGVLYGGRNSLYTIDVTTGKTTLVGSGGFVDVRGLEFITIPEPTTLGIVAIGFMALIHLPFARSRGAIELFLPSRTIP